MSLKNKVLSLKGVFEKNLFLLFLSSQLRSISAELIGIFGMIFLFEKYGQSIIWLVIFNTIGSLLMILLVPILGKLILNTIGFKKSIIIGSILYALLNFSFLLFDVSVLWASVLNILLTTAARVFYWIPYNIEFATFSNGETRGFQIGAIKSITTMFTILTPIVSGFIVTVFGFEVLFIIAAILYIISIEPLLKIEHIKEDYSFSYFETFKKIFTKDFFDDFILFFLEGMEVVVNVVMWPIVMYFIFNEDFAELGIMLSLITLFTLVFNLVIGKISDKSDKRNMAKWGNIFYAISWIFRMISMNAFQVFIASIYHKFTECVARIPYESYWNEKEVKKGLYIDEYIVIREIGLHSGRVFAGIIIIIFLVFISKNIQGTLFLGFISAFIMGLLITKEVISNKKI